MIKQLIIIIFSAFIFIEAQAQILGDPIVTWDFADGIPSDWQMGINSTNQIAQWEYRGPSTTPDYNTGPRGSCAGNTSPILSETQSNGFVIFDSNFWDDGDNICGELGTGVDPAPHTAFLVTSSLDLSSREGAILTFQQQFHHYQASTKVQVSVDGGNNWVEVFSNNVSQSPNVEWKSVNVSSIAAGESDVRFKFVFQGTYYWWLLDDISVYEPLQNDLKLVHAAYTTNLGLSLENPFLDLEYDQYPSNMIPSMHFSAATTNVGALDQTGVDLNVRIVRDNATEILNTNSASNTLNSGSSFNYEIVSNYTPPSILGEYEIFYNVLQNETDDNLADNADTLDFTISPFTFSRDEQAMEDYFIPDPEYASSTWQIGNYFQIFSANRSCHSMQVAVAEGTPIGTLIKGRIYLTGIDSLIAETAEYAVNYADLNSIGEQKMITLQLTTPLQLQDDSLYIAMATQINSGDDLRIARSGESQGESSIIYYPDINASFVSFRVPMVRMNIFGATALAGCMDADANNYNPSANVDDGSCQFIGCSHPDADNFNPQANSDDGSCVIGGCTNSIASNYNQYATYDNASCIYLGCMDSNAINYDANANQDDGSCNFLQAAMTVAQNVGCAPFEITITNQSAALANSSCTFTINDEVIQSECVEQFNYLIETAGNYELKFTYTLDNAVGDTTINIVVLPSPAVPIISYNDGSHEIYCLNCSGDVIWNNNGSTITGAQDDTLNTYFEGAYQNGFYSVTAIDVNTCTSSALPLFVLAPYFETNLTEGCAPFGISVINQTDAVDGLILTLNYGDGTIAENFNGIGTHVYQNPGSYDLSLQANSPNGSATIGTTIVVSPFIQPIVLQDGVVGTVYCSNCDQFEEVNWNIDGTVFTGNNIYPDSSDLYVVTGVTEAGCSGVTTFSPESILSVNDFEYLLYPNPANTSLTLSVPTKNNLGIAIYNMTGEKAMALKTYNNGTTVIDVSQLPIGLYTVVLSANGVSKTSLFEIMR